MKGKISRSCVAAVVATPILAAMLPMTAASAQDVTTPPPSAAPPSSVEGAVTTSPTDAAPASSVPVQGGPGATPGGVGETVPQGQAATSAAPGGASAPASSAANGLNPDIVVTANKREQNLRQVPASISAFTGQALQTRGVARLTDLNASVPALQIASNNNQVILTIRGVGSGILSSSGESAVALHLDGVYLARPEAGQSAFFDVQRVEVLRGPQGSLYGRNATGGAINVVSVAPSATPTGYILGTVGNYARTDVEGAIGGPIAGDTITGRIGAYFHRRGDGFGTNLFTGKDIERLHEFGGKAAVQFKPTDKFTFTLRGDFSRGSDSNAGYHFIGDTRQPFPGATTLAEYLGGRGSPKVRDINSDVDPRRRDTIWGVLADANWNVGDGVTVKSLTAYRRSRDFFLTDVDGTQLPIFGPFGNRNNAHQFSEELQLNLKKNDFYVVAGAYYFNEIVDGHTYIETYLNRGIPALGIPAIFPPPFGRFNQVSHSRTGAEAVFANVDWTGLSKLTLSLGLRYSLERKANRGFNITFFPDFVDYPATGYETVDDARHSHGFTPKFTAKYDITSEINVYGSIGRGFKSGQWIAGTPQYAKPEFLWSYEAGVKGRAFDNHLSFAIDAFYYKYHNLQVQKIQTPITILENSPGGTLKGIEGEATLVLPAGLQVDGNFTLLDTKIKGFLTQDPNILGNPERDLTGNKFAFAPGASFVVGAQKRFTFGRTTGTLRADVQYTSHTYLDLFNNKSNAYRPAFAVLNASYRHDFGNGFSLTAFGRNLTNKTVLNYSIINNIPNLLVPTITATPPYPVAGTNSGILNEPRTFGLTARYQW